MGVEYIKYNRKLNRREFMSGVLFVLEQDSSIERYLNYKQLKIKTMSDCPELSDHEKRKEAHRAAGLDVSEYNKPNADYHPPKIKEENKGKFTASAKRAGKSVQTYAKQVIANPPSEKLRKEAQFAANAATWDHSKGGKKKG